MSSRLSESWLMSYTIPELMFEAHTSPCVCWLPVINFDVVNTVLGVLEGTESDSDVIEAVRPMVDELWLSRVTWQVRV